MDAHAGIDERMSGETVARGCPFRRARQAGCPPDDRVFRIGLRGSGHAPGNFDRGRDRGWTVVQAEECRYRSLARSRR